MTETDDTHPAQLAIFTTDLMGGGVGRMMTELAIAFAEGGYAVDLVVCDDSGERIERVRASGVRVVKLAKSSTLAARTAALRVAPRSAAILARPVLLPVKTVATLAYLPALIRYLCNAKPGVLLAAKTECNIIASLAGQDRRARSRIIVSERNMIGAQYQNKARSRVEAKKWVALAQMAVSGAADAFTNKNRGM